VCCALLAAAIGMTIQAILLLHAATVPLRRTFYVSAEIQDTRVAFLGQMDSERWAADPKPCYTAD
jgi:hypothetical protein